MMAKEEEPKTKVESCMKERKNKQMKERAKGRVNIKMMAKEEGPKTKVEPQREGRINK